MNGVKKGDTVYIVRGGIGFDAEVVYAGDVHFMAANATYRRSDDSLVVGTHARQGTAYTSEKSYTDWKEKRLVWTFLRAYVVRMGEEPPAHLSADEIETIRQLLTGKE